MLQRCINPNSPDYPSYGGRGIKVCDRWFNFENFLADMGEKPYPDFSIDRYPDKNGNYEPGNCRWATSAEQQRNLRKNRYVTYNGITKLLIDWASEMEMPYDLLLKRVNAGMEGDQLFAPSYNRYEGIPGAKRRKRESTAQKYTAYGKTLSIEEWSKELGISRNTLEQRLYKYKMPPEKALISAPLKKGKEGPRKGHTMITAFGRTQSLTAWANEFSMPVSTLKNRIFRAGMKPEDALQ